jgi:peptide-methionine (S)-S-oxide reductase
MSSFAARPGEQRPPYGWSSFSQNRVLRFGSLAPPPQISLGKILQIYFSIAHNPTELNRQGLDVGTQYRSAIFHADDEQKKVAAAYVAQLDKAKVFLGPIVTQLEPLRGFYPAEDYHQDFAVLHPSYPYIVFNDLPKVDNLKRMFMAEYRETPVTVMAASKAGE